MTRSTIGPWPEGPSRRKIFSIMMMDESTIIPKSTAPSDKRFADWPVLTSPMMATMRASGMLMAVMIAARTLLRKSTSTSTTRAMPIVAFSTTV